jgi:hypothetical protein
MTPFATGYDKPRRQLDDPVWEAEQAVGEVSIRFVWLPVGGDDLKGGLPC